MRNKQDYCALHKNLIINDSGCDMWQERKNECDTSDVNVNSTLADYNVVVWDLDNI